MDVGWQEPGFSLLEWKFTDKPGKEAGMIHLVRIRVEDISKNSYLA